MNTSAAKPAFPHLVADVGGTHARFAWVPAPGEPPTEVMVLSSADFVQIKDAALHYLSTLGTWPRQACIGIATPLQGDQVSMTNHAWSFSARALKEALALDRLLLVNDFTALALGVPTLVESQLQQVGAGICRAGPKAILGPGTGLGASTLVPVAGGYVPVAGEGGHVTLAASNAEEAAVVAWLWSEWPHVSAERVLSGPGLALLFTALAAVRGLHVEPRSARQITQEATQRPGEFSCDVVDMFLALLGTVASNHALMVGARGGVYLGGGILPALGDVIPSSSFRSRFESKGRYAHYLAQIPTWVIHSPHVALIGASSALELAQVMGGVDIRD